VLILLALAPLPLLQLLVLPLQLLKVLLVLRRLVVHLSQVLALARHEALRHLFLQQVLLRLPLTLLLAVQQALPKVLRQVVPLNQPPQAKAQHLLQLASQRLHLKVAPVLVHHKALLQHQQLNRLLRANHQHLAQYLPLKVPRLPRVLPALRCLHLNLQVRLYRVLVQVSQQLSHSQLLPRCLLLLKVRRPHNQPVPLSLRLLVVHLNRPLLHNHLLVVRLLLPRVVLQVPRPRVQVCLLLNRPLQANLVHLHRLPLANQVRLVQLVHHIVRHHLLLPNLLLPVNPAPVLVHHKAPLRLSLQLVVVRLPLKVRHLLQQVNLQVPVNQVHRLQHLRLTLLQLQLL